MSSKKLRAIALVLVCAMTLVAALSGCGKNGGSTAPISDEPLNPLGVEPFSKETITLEVMMPSHGSVIDYDSNKYTMELERMGNVELKFNLLPPGDATTKINLVLSSGQDLPDIINTPLDDSVVSTYGEAGRFVVLNEYYDKSSYYIKPQVEAYEEEYGINLLDYITMSDGNIYGIIKYNESLQNEVVNPLWINKVWLEKAGMKTPTTLDELVTVLKYFKANDMNGNGKNDEVALVDYAEGGMLEVIENAFVRTGVDNFTILDDGTLDLAFETEGYKEFLKYAAQLYADGLIDPVTFSQDNTTRNTLLNVETPIVGVFAATSTSPLTAGTPRRENHEYGPMFLDNPDKPGYSTFRYLKTMPNQALFITEKCEYPETAFRLADYMCSEKMTVWSRWGEEGTDWLVPAESVKGMYDFMGYPAYLEPVLQWGSSQNAHWQNGTPGFRRTNISLGMTDADSSQQSKAYAIEELHNRYSDSDWKEDGKLFFEKATNERVYKILYTAEELDEISAIKTALSSYYKQTRYEFITGKKNVDKDWDAYIKELKSMNIDRYVEITNEAYNRMK